MRLIILYHHCPFYMFVLFNLLYRVLGGSFGTMADLTPGLKEAECLQGLGEALNVSLPQVRACLHCWVALFGLLSYFIWAGPEQSQLNSAQVFLGLALFVDHLQYIYFVSNLPHPFYKTGYYSYNLEDLKIMHFKWQVPDTSSFSFLKINK